MAGGTDVMDRYLVKIFNGPPLLPSWCVDGNVLVGVSMVDRYTWRDNRDDGCWMDVLRTGARGVRTWGAKCLSKVWVFLNESSSRPFIVNGGVWT